MALTHGYVTGGLIRSIGDGDDPDRLPDVVAATDVKLSFIPAVKQFVSPTGRLVVSDSIPAGVMADGQVTGDVDSTGAVLPGAEPGLWLVIGSYTVRAQGHYSDFKITVTEDHTEAAPLDLGTAVSVGPGPSVTLQTMALPQGAADGQVLGWDGGLAWVAQSGGGGGDPLTSYSQVSGLADYPETFPADLSDTATAAQGALADSAVQPGDLGTAATTDATAYATAAQGATADTAVQPAAIADFITAEDVPAAPTWSTIDGKPAVVAEGTSQANARAAIGAGTSSLTVGSTASDAKAGDWTPGLADLPAGSTFAVIWDGTDWTYAGDVISVRPSARTDLTMLAFGGNSEPSFAISGDIWHGDAAPAPEYGFVGSDSMSNISTASMDVTIPSNVQDGDVAWIIVDRSDTDTETLPGGWTQREAVQSSGKRRARYTKTLTAAEADTDVTITVPTGGIKWISQLIVFRGVDPTEPEAAQTPTTTINDALLDIPSATSVATTEQFIVCGGRQTDVTELDPPAGWTKVQERYTTGGGSNQAALAYRNAAAPGAISGTWVADYNTAHADVASSLIIVNRLAE